MLCQPTPAAQFLSGRHKTELCTKTEGVTLCCGSHPQYRMLRRGILPPSSANSQLPIISNEIIRMKARQGKRMEMPIISLELPLHWQTEPVRALSLDTRLDHHPGTPGCSPCRLQLANNSGSNTHLHHVLIKTVLLRFLRSDQHGVHISELRAVQWSVGIPHLSAYPTVISYSLILCFVLPFSFFSFSSFYVLQSWPSVYNWKLIKDILVYLSKKSSLSPWAL